MTPEERAALRAKLAELSIDELRAVMAWMAAEVRSITDAESVTPEQDARLDVACEEAIEVRDVLEKREARQRKVAEIRKSELTPGAPEFEVGRKVNPNAVNLRTASRNEMRDAALKVVETEGKHLAPFQQDGIEKLLRGNNGDCDSREIAKLLLLTETEGYRSAFVKGITQTNPAFTPEEVRAINEYRAANEGTGSAGGYGIPVLIDPTIILSSGALEAPILSLATIKTITTDAWKGVTAPGATWSFVAEAGVVTDGTPALSQPSIPVYKAAGFIPYSIEVGQDYPGFADEMAMVLGQGYTDLIAAQSMTGSGSSQPTGLFTAMANTTTSPAHSKVTTAGEICALDVREVWAQMPERFRPGSTWVMNVQVEALIRAFGNGLALSDFTVNLAADGTSVLMGKPVVLTDYAPGFTGTTGAENFLVVGDVSQFYIIQRAGMTVELVQHLFDTSSGRPTGQRGWYAYTRLGFDVVNHNALRILANS
jgi:HK97 family phage major capsid protein